MTGRTSHLMRTLTQWPTLTICLLLAGCGRAAGADVPYDLAWPATGDGPWPVAVIGHAYLTDAEHYAWLSGALVAAGWVVAVPRTQMTWAADPDSFAADLAAALADVRGLGADPATALHGRLGGQAVAIGHSLGGAAALRAAAAGGFDALVTLAVLDGGSPPTRRKAPQVTVPTLMMAVAGDCVTPVADHELPVWERLGAADRTGILLHAGTHCGFAGPDPDCTGAEAGCGTPAMDASDQQARTAQLLLLWLRAVLAADMGARQALQADLAGATDLDWRGGMGVPAQRGDWGGLRGLYR